MERELSDQERQILEALGSWIGASCSLGLVDAAQHDEIFDVLDRNYDALWQAIYTMRQQGMIEGIAWGLILAGRHDLIALIPEVEKAAVVITAERLHRKDDNDA